MTSNDGEQMPGTKLPEEVRREQILQAAYEIASKRGLAAITIRGVARRADASSGLVSFHFESREGLGADLLDWVLSTTAILTIGLEVQKIEDPLERLMGVLRQEMLRLAGDPARMRVISEFWISGIRDKQVKLRMQRALDRYRHAFLPLAKEAIEAEPGRFEGITADSLATVAVGFIKGCAVQAMVDPRLKVEEFTRVAGQLLVPSQKMRKQRGVPLGLAYGSLELLSGPHP
jgi:TetR/AcrR family transcriptional repressor of bet genes